MSKYQNEYIDSCTTYLNTVKDDLTVFADMIDMEEIEAAANLIIEAGKSGNRVHISGIGKPAHIAGYISSLISSTGTPTYFLHGTEAVHGSCGQLRFKIAIVYFLALPLMIPSTFSAIATFGCIFSTKSR